MAPLDNLQELSMTRNIRFKTEILCALLEKFSNLVEFTPPGLRKTVNVDTISQTVAHHCPRIQSLTQGSNAPPNSHSAIMEIIQGIPKVSLKSLVFTGFEDQEEQLFTTLHPQFGSLTRIEFEGCEALSSKIIQKILCGCLFLEAFNATNPAPDVKCSMKLEDAIALPWMITRIVSLGLMIDLGVMDIPDVGSRYLNLAQKKWLDALKAFYKQVGDLRSRCILDMTVLARRYGVAKSKTCFPGIIKLGGRTRSNDRGWLKCLSKLNELECFYGSFNVMPLGEGDCMMGQEEVDHQVLAEVA